MNAVRAVALAAGIAWFPVQAAAASPPACTAGPADLTLRSDVPPDADSVRYHGLAGKLRHRSKAVPLCADTRYRIVPAGRSCTVAVPTTGTADSIRASIARQVSRRRGCPQPPVSVATDAPGGATLPARRIVPSGSIDTRYRREVVVMVDPTPLRTTVCTRFTVPNAVGMTVAALEQAYRNAGCTVAPRLSDGRLLDAAGDRSQALVDAAWPPLSHGFDPGMVRPVWYLRPSTTPRHTPNLTGMTFDTARRTAREKGFPRLTAFRDGEAVDATGDDLVTWQYPAAEEATDSDAIVVQAKPKTGGPGKCIVGPVTEDEATTVAGLERAYRSKDRWCRGVKVNLVTDGRLLDRKGLDADAWIVTATSPSRKVSFDAATETPIWIVRRARALMAPNLVEGTVDGAARTTEALGLPPPLVIADDRLVAAAGASTRIVAEQQPAAGQPITERLVVRVRGPADGDPLPPPAVLVAGAGAGIAGGELVRRLARRQRNGKPQGDQPGAASRPAAADPYLRRVRARADLPPPVTSPIA